MKNLNTLLYKLIIKLKANDKYAEALQVKWWHILSLYSWWQVSGIIKASKKFDSGVRVNRDIITTERLTHEMDIKEMTIE
jgi:hypothetical protein